MRAIVITLATIAAAAASDVKVDDFRAEVGVTPGPSSTDEDFTKGPGSTRSSGSRTYKSSAPACADLWLGWTFSEIHDDGFVAALGMDVAVGVHTPSGLGGGSLQYQTFSPQVRAGWAHAFNTSFHIELTPFVGYGVAHAQWSDSGENDDGWGTALTYGVLAAGWGRLGRGWTLGGNAGYQGGLTNVSVEHSGTGGHSDLTMTTSGVVARLGIGYQF